MVEEAHILLLHKILTFRTQLTTHIPLDIKILRLMDSSLDMADINKILLMEVVKTDIFNV
jgi:hypothetical protein